jgi:5-methylcytosine-specific restriction protein A
MTDWSAILDEKWDDLKPELVGSFTTQTFGDLVKVKVPSAWEELVALYGLGGKGSGQSYSPNTALANYLKDKSKDSSVISDFGYVPSSPGWGSPVVKQWKLAGEVAPPTLPEDVAFGEGKKSYRTHLVTERAHGLRNHVLKVRGHTGLFCDICKITGEKLEEDLRSALFEVHHKAEPLAESGETTTTADDVALLCACCHRLVHRLITVRKRWFTIEEARSILPMPSE